MASTSNGSNVNMQQIEQELIKHLNVLYGDPQNLKGREQFVAANKFLTEFRKHPQAWNVCLTILSQTTNTTNNNTASANTTNFQILTFSSQTVYDNLLENWRNINEPQRMQIVTTLQKFIQSFSDKHLPSYLQPSTANNHVNQRNQQLMHQNFRFIFNKTCQTIAFLALNANQATNMIESVLKSCLSIQLPQQLSLLWVNLEILNAFALEFEQHHVSETIISETRDFLTTKYRDAFLKIMVCSLLAAQKYQTTLVRLVQLTFATLKHWIKIVDITLERMDYIGLLDEVLKVMYFLYQSGDHAQAKQFMVESISRIVNKGIVNSDDRNDYEKILHKISMTLSKLEPSLQKAIQSNHMDTIRSLCNLICSFCETEARFIAKGDGVNLNLVKMILQFTSHSSTMITTETFGFWARLQDIGMNDRHPSLQKDVFLQLLRALLLHSTDPQEFDEHSRFRSNSSEIFISVYFTLQKQYFVEIEKQLKELFESIKTANDPDLVFVRIESCIFALSIIGQEVMDEADESHIQQALNQHIKPICEALCGSNLHKMQNINATSLHLLNQICHFFKRYSFYICKNAQLLHKCLLYNIEIPCKHQAIMVYECAQTLNRLLYHSIPIWMEQLNDFENVIVKFVIENIGDGQQFYSQLSQTEKDLLEDITIVDITDSDAAVVDPITRQQRGCALYYESICMVIDVYSDKTRQSALINTLISAPLKSTQSIFTNLTNSDSNVQLTTSVYYQIVTNLRIFSAFFRGLQTTDTGNHPLIPHIQKILDLCLKLTKQIPILLSQSTVGDEQKSSSDLQMNGNDTNQVSLNVDMLYNAVCDIMECVLEIFGSTTSNIVDGLVSMALEILKGTKSEASARILKKMVSTFAKQTNLANNFITLIKDAIIYFSNGSVEDIKLYHKTINEIFECVAIQIESYANSSEVWTQVVPNCIALALKLLTNIQDREGLKNALKILNQIFDAQHVNALNQIGNELKTSLLPNMICILFNGVAVHFERMVVSKVYDVYYNLMQWQPEYTKQQTIVNLAKLQVAAFQEDKNKQLFMTAFWKQRANARKFKLVMTTFYSVCHNFNTPDSFGGMLE